MVWRINPVAKRAAQASNRLKKGQLAIWKVSCNFQNRNFVCEQNRKGRTDGFSAFSLLQQKGDEKEIQGLVDSIYTRLFCRLYSSDFDQAGSCLPQEGWEFYRKAPFLHENSIYSAFARTLSGFARTASPVLLAP
jgi:hypothetical protein